MLECVQDMHRGWATGRPQWTPKGPLPKLALIKLIESFDLLACIHTRPIYFKDINDLGNQIFISNSFLLYLFFGKNEQNCPETKQLCTSNYCSVPGEGPSHIVYCGNDIQNISPIWVNKKTTPKKETNDWRSCNFAKIILLRAKIGSVRHLYIREITGYKNRFICRCGMNIKTLRETMTLKIITRLILFFWDKIEKNF